MLDDRQEFANQERFPTANEAIVLDSFHRALEVLRINPDSYLVILTRGHAHDQTVLRPALQTKAGYIGMIGSRRKRNAVYANLEKEGFSRPDFDRVFSPIGPLGPFAHYLARSDYCRHIRETSEYNLNIEGIKLIGQGIQKIATLSKKPF